MKNNKILRIALLYAACAAAAFAVFYFVLPPLNFQSKDFWYYLTFLAVLFTLPFGIFSGTAVTPKRGMPVKRKFRKAPVIALVAPVALILLLNLFSSQVFNAKKYASVVEIEEAKFEEDMPETDNVTNIALMDSQSAAILGNRTLGSLSKVVSQYEIGLTYNQINYKRTPQKVANLEYADFFKWLNNRSSGIPGFVMVDPVNNNAQYIETAKSVRYADSGYFSDDLLRRLRFSYPTKIFSSIRFEIDEQGDPYYIVSCMKANVGVFGAMDVSEVIIFDPCTGESEICAVADAPAWIDTVYNGNLASEKYNWYGMLSNGYWNSIFGNVDCKKTTDDFGYIVIEDDVWYFTGVTSVNSDESNIGFIITNARTGEYKFYPVVGAEEYSAMAAAEGEVQEKGYVASFPSLVNISGQATYIMVLKDSGGLVKLYALVNVQNYSLVTTGQTQQEAMTEYRKLLASSGVIDSSQTVGGEEKDAQIKVADIRLVTLGGDTVAYITPEGENGVVYKMSLADDERLMLIRAGDSIALKYKLTPSDGIRLICGWEFK